MTTRRAIRELPEFCDYLGSRDLSPKTVIDVEAAWGTTELLHSLPEAYHILIDPLPTYKDRLEAVLKKWRGEYHAVALSDVSGEMLMSIHDGNEVGAALSTAEQDDGIRVAVSTLDDMFLSRKDLEAPIMVKTDCQGFDMHVIRGGRQFLKRVDVVVCEVNVLAQQIGQTFPTWRHRRYYARIWLLQFMMF